MALFIWGFLSMYVMAGFGLALFIHKRRAELIRRSNDNVESNKAE